MEDVLYIKIDQNIPVQHTTLTYDDIATLYCVNKKVVAKLKQEIFYTLDANEQKTMFTIEKVYEGIHKVYPSLRIENVGERDFIVDYEKAEETDGKKILEYVKTAAVCLVTFFGSAFTIMTFNQDVSVADVFDHIYQMVLGKEAVGNNLIEICYSIGIPVGMLFFYNHVRRRKIKNDPTPIQVEMCTYEEQVNKAMIKTASREGKTIDIH